MNKTNEIKLERRKECNGLCPKCCGSKQKEIENAYAFEDGKTYMIAVDTDEAKKIQEIKDELNFTNPLIRWIIVSKEFVEPVTNPESLEELKRMNYKYGQLSNKYAELRYKTETELNKHKEDKK